MENSLPIGWINTTLSEIASINYGKDFRKNNLSEEVGYPVYSANGIIGYSKTYNIEHETVVLGCRGSVGSVHLAKPKSFITHNCFSIEPFAFIENRFIKYLLESSDLTPVITGTAQPQITITNLSPLQILIPPLAEQYRIVAKLDSLMEKIEDAKKKIERIPIILKRFRQSVLAAAVSGDGTETSTDDVCDLIQIGPFGTQLHRHDYISNGIPLINPTHIQQGRVVPDMDFTIDKLKYKELSNYHLKEGDVVMGRRGEMARCAPIGSKENGWLCGTGSLFFRPNQEKINPKYLLWSLSNSNTKSFLEEEAKGTTMSNLNLNTVKRIPIHLPLLEEQIAIVSQVEAMFALADKIEARYIKAKAQFDKLTQSILAKAFKGELVEQNPKDEPASVLLERIRKEKEQRMAKGKKERWKREIVRSFQIQKKSKKAKAILDLVIKDGDLTYYVEVKGGKVSEQELFELSKLSQGEFIMKLHKAIKTGKIMEQKDGKGTFYITKIEKG